jgi:hypothetical protein
MSAYELPLEDLLRSLGRGAYPLDMDTEWDAESGTFKRIIHVPQANGSWRTYHVDSLRADLNTQPPASASRIQA